VRLSTDVTRIVSAGHATQSLHDHDQQVSLAHIYALSSREYHGDDPFVFFLMWARSRYLLLVCVQLVSSPRALGAAGLLLCVCVMSGLRLASDPLCGVRVGGPLRSWMAPTSITTSAFH
jgi:hypothetical protein